MKIMTWNTLFAGFDGNDETRRQLQLEVIREIAPDILLLQELKNFEANGSRLLFQTEDAIAMRGLLGIAPHTGQNTAVFICGDIKPIAFDVDAVHFHHAASVAQLKVPHLSENLIVASVHLCPNTPRVRWREASYLTNYADPQKLALVAGDFNSLSPHDDEPKGWESLPAHFRSRYILPGAESADRETLATFLHQGFVDVGHRLEKHRTTTVPGAAFTSSEFVPFRCDYVMATPRLAAAAVTYFVIKDERTGRASDHYPIVTEFQLPGHD